MPERDYRLYLFDILDSGQAIQNAAKQDLFATRSNNRDTKWASVPLKCLYVSRRLALIEHIERIGKVFHTPAEAP